MVIFILDGDGALRIMMSEGLQYSIGIVLLSENMFYLCDCQATD